MDTLNISNYIEAWLANNAGRANSMSMHIYKITDENLEICIDGKVLQIGIPHNFYTSCSSDGIIRNTNSAFVAKSDESNSMELMTALNEKFDRLRSRGFYSFSSVLDSILDAFERYKSSTECDRAASNFHGEGFGLGSQVLQEVLKMPLELIDLEISLAFAAANGRRDVFEPFPPFLLKESEIDQHSDVLNISHIANPNGNPNNQIAYPNGNPNCMSIGFENKNMVALRSIIKSFPSASEMRLSADEDELKEKLAKSWLSTTEGESAQKLGDEHLGKEVWQLSYNVLRFILCPNRPSLVFLSEDDDKILKLDNSHSQFYQFAVVQDSPEREVVYKSINKNEGSIFGFHGSSIQNWYSILRNGLLCLSNTNLMSYGNTMGDGIYLASSFASSAFFSMGCRNHWMNGMYKEGIFAVSICEVISAPTIQEESGNNILVPKGHEGHVAVRYLLVYHASTRVNVPQVRISDGHILSHGDHNVDLSQHYERLRKKYGIV